MENIYMVDEDTAIGFHQPPNQLQFVDASGEAFFTMPYGLWQKLPPEKQEQMSKELQSVVDRYAI